MKVSKKSLIASIAVLCVCALSLTAASFAWFTTVTKADVNALNLGVTSSSDLKIAIEDEAVTVDEIEGTKWGVTFNGGQIDDEYDTYSANEKLVDASYIDGAMVKPADMDAIKADGTYEGAWASALAQTGTYDYMTFTVYFRSTEAGKTINFNATNFAIPSGNQNLLPALTLKVNDQVYTNETGLTGVACTTGTEPVTAVTGGQYYIGQATFTIYVDGESEFAINQNSGVNFNLSNINFTYAA